MFKHQFFDQRDHDLIKIVNSAYDSDKTRGYTRKLLKHDHLLEMPEEWNPIAFDDPVHANMYVVRPLKSGIGSDSTGVIPPVFKN